VKKNPCQRAPVKELGETRGVPEPPLREGGVFAAREKLGKNVRGGGKVQRVYRKGDPTGGGLTSSAGEGKRGFGP